LYLFSLKNNRTNADVVFIRGLFAVTGSVAFAQSFYHGMFAFVIGLILIAVSFFVKRIKQSYKISTTVFLLLGTAILCGITQAWYFVFIPILYLGLEKVLGKETFVQVDDNNVIIKKPLSTKSFAWKEIEHIVLKDGLLTIDFNNNHFIQSEIDTDTEEEKFNQYCTSHLINKV